MSVFDPCDHVTSGHDKDALHSLCSFITRDRRSVAVEIGSWVGSTAVILADYFDRVFCIDPFTGNPDDRLGTVAERYGTYHLFQTFCRNAGDLLYRKIFPCPGTSDAYARIWPFDVDLVFIDARHDYDSVKQDILLWAPLVKSGGILCGHDYSQAFPGVKQAVDELIPKAELRLQGSVWSTTCR